MTIELTFYTTDGCHLCEEAVPILQRLLAEAPGVYQVESIDIVESEALVQRYGLRIPVIAKEGDIDGLGWPFDYSAVLNYLTAT